MLNANFGFSFLNFVVKLIRLSAFIFLRVEYSLQKLEVRVEN